MTKHTKGPWGFGKTGEDSRLILGKGGKGNYVCRVQIHQTPRQYGMIYESEREANARLIAAAPELLEALTELADLVDAIREGEYRPDSFTTQPARAAIAKAKGEPT